MSTFSEVRLVDGKAKILNVAHVLSVETTDPRRGLTLSKVTLTNGMHEYVVGSPLDVAARLGDVRVLAETEEETAELAAADERRSTRAKGKGANPPHPFGKTPVPAQEVE